VIGNTMLLGLVGALTVVLPVGSCCWSRPIGRAPVHCSAEVAALGYAIPGTVLAVAIMLAFIRWIIWPVPPWPAACWP
jgi:iron(III) transport system permease protein